MRVVLSVVFTGVGLTAVAGWVGWLRRRANKLVKKAQIATGLKADDQPLAPIAALTDLATLTRVTGDPMCLSWVGDHVTSLVIRGAGASLAYLHPLVGNMTSLVKLDMSGSAVHYLPYFMSSLVSLQDMVFSRCQLNFIPAEVGDMPALTNLDLSRNALGKVPDALCRLTGLTSLNLMCNQLTAIPSEIGSLTRLRILGLKSNRLVTLPDSFTRLASLVELFITDNALVTLPTGFGSLTSLVKLQASFNSLSQLPPDMLNLPRLEMMRVAVCTLDALPAALHAPGATPTANSSLLPAALHAPGATTPEANSSLLPAALHAPGPTPTANSSLLPAVDGAADGVLAGVMANGGGHAEGNGTVGGGGVLPRLAWFSLSGNGACAPLPAPRAGLQQFQASDLDELLSGAKLGDGASGEVRSATIKATGEKVAIKQFRADVSPDGRTEEEVGIACAVDHPHLTQVIGVVPGEASTTSAASAAAAPPPLLVMRLVTGQPMAAKPTSEHLLRCKWGPEVRFTLQQCVCVATGVAAALEHLHAHNICHGDVYAHNILVDSDTCHATLCDFGASFSYHPHELFWEAMEVRAYGLFLKDLVDRLVDTPATQADTLATLVEQCTQAPGTQRPGFSHIRQTLLAITPATA